MANSVLEDPGFSLLGLDTFTLTSLPDAVICKAAKEELVFLGVCEASVGTVIQVSVLHWATQGP